MYVAPISLSRIQEQERILNIRMTLEIRLNITQRAGLDDLRSLH
jgi:hypothetical protein